jgi:hypothetical protein
MRHSSFRNADEGCLPGDPRLTGRSVSEAPPKKKDVKVHVLRCRSESCRALLPFEETDEDVLLGNMIDLATREGGSAFFPCPRCGGHNIVEEVVVDGKRRTRVTGFSTP